MGSSVAPVQPTYSPDNPFVQQATAPTYSDDNPFAPKSILKPLKIPVAPREATQVGPGPANPNPTHFPEPFRSVGQYLVDPALEHPLSTMATMAAAPVVASGMAAAGVGAPVISAALGATMLPRAAEYAGQKAAELTLPPDVRAQAERLSDRVPGREAATMAGAAILPNLIHSALSARGAPPPEVPTEPLPVDRQLASGNRPISATARVAAEPPATPSAAPNVEDAQDVTITPKRSVAPLRIPGAPPTELAPETLAPTATEPSTLRPPQYSPDNPFWDHELQRDLPAEGPPRTTTGLIHLKEATTDQLAKEYADLIEAKARHEGVAASLEGHPAFAEAAALAGPKPPQKRDVGTSLNPGSGRFVPTSEDDYAGLNEDQFGALERGGLPPDTFKQHADATAAAAKAETHIARVEAELTKRGIDHADAWAMATSGPQAVQASRRKYSQPKATDLSLFAGNDLFGGAGTMGDTDVGAGGKAPVATGAAPDTPGAISPDEMAARRNELGAPASDAEATARGDQQQGSLFEGGRRYLASPEERAQFAALRPKVGAQVRPGSRWPAIGDAMTPEIADRIISGEGHPAVVDDDGKIWTNRGAPMEHGDLMPWARDIGDASFEKGEHSGWILDKKFVSERDLQRVLAPGEKPAVEASRGSYTAPSKAQMDLFKSPAAALEETERAFGKLSPSVQERLDSFPVKYKTWSSLVGEKLAQVSQLHELLFAFRDPREERLHVILTKKIAGDALGRSEIVSHTMESSGQLSMVQVALDKGWIQNIVARAKETGADEVILSHNHPSGDPTPSAQDEVFTNYIGSQLAVQPWASHPPYPLTLRGHYVIDHGKGSWIEAGDGRYGVRTVPFEGMKTPQGAIDWTNQGAPQLAGPEALTGYVDKLIRQAEPDGNGILAIYIDAETKPVAIEPHPVSAIDHLHEHLGPQAKALGADRVFLAAPPEAAPALRKMLAMRRLGVQIPDVVYYHQGPDGPVIQRDFATSAQNVNAGPVQPSHPSGSLDAQRIFAPRTEYTSAAGGGKPPEGDTRRTAADDGGLVPKNTGVVVKAQTALRRAADFFATASHDPLARARRIDPAYAELGDKAMAAKPFAAHFARTTAHWSDEHLTPEEAQTLSRVQIIGRLKDINAREDQGQLAFIPDDAGARAQRDATIARYQAMVPKGFMAQPKVQEALARRMKIYADVMEPAAIQGNVPASSFSAAPTGHIKLIPVKPKEEPTPAVKSAEQGGTRTAQAAQTAKGTAMDYETDWETVLGSDARDKFQAATANQFYHATADRGRTLEPGEQVKPGETRVSFRDPANVIPEARFVGQGPRLRVALKTELAQAFAHVDKELAPSGMATSDVAAFGRAIDNVAGRVMFTLNPAALASHTRNLAAQMGSVPEAGPLGWLTAGTGLVPGAKVGRGFAEILRLDLRSPQLQAIKLRLASVGALRPIELSFGGLGEKFAQAKKDFLKRAGSRLSPEQKAQISKLSVFGENGLDERARVGIAMKYLRQKPKATDGELGRYVNRIAANYTRGMGGVVVNALQKYRFAMFARIETAKLGLGARTLVGRSLLPSDSPQQAAELWIKQLMLGPVGNKLGLAALLAGASLLLAKQLTQAPGHENDLPTGGATATGDEQYLSGRFFNPADAVTQDLGLDALARGDVTGAKQQLTNTALRTTISNPIAKLAFAGAFGAEPNVDRSGTLRPLGPPSLTGVPRLKSIGRAAADVTALSPFTRDYQPNPGMDATTGRAMSYLGLNVTTSAKASPEVKLSMARQDVSAWLDKMTSALAHHAVTIDEAVAEAQKAGDQNADIAFALVREHALKKLYRAAGRAGAVP